MAYTDVKKMDVKDPARPDRPSKKQTVQEVAKEPFPEFKTKMLVAFKNWMIHEYSRNWQLKAFKNLLSAIPAHTLVSGWDFIMNYSCVEKTEAQASFFVRNQVTLLSGL